MLSLRGHYWPTIRIGVTAQDVEGKHGLLRSGRKRVAPLHAPLSGPPEWSRLARSRWHRQGEQISPVHIGDALRAAEQHHEASTGQNCMPSEPSPSKRALIGNSYETTGKAGPLPALPALPSVPVLGPAASRCGISEPVGNWSDHNWRRAG